MAGWCDRPVERARRGCRHWPRTNGKAERFIRTLIKGWAYGAVYRTSVERTAALADWLDWYNRLRPHR